MLASGTEQLWTTYFITLYFGTRHISQLRDIPLDEMIDNDNSRDNNISYNLSKHHQSIKRVILTFHIDTERTAHWRNLELIPNITWQNEVPRLTKLA